MKNVLDFVKAHVIALSCALVGVLALIAYFVYPVPSLFAQLKTEVDQRSDVYKSLDGLRSSSRTLPNIDINTPEPKPLPQFPTERVIKAGEEALQRLTDQSNGVLGAAVKMNQRPLLVPGSLPKPSPLARNDFLNAYKAITQQYGEGAKNGLIATTLKGVLPPSDQELNAIAEAAVNQIIKDNLQIGPNGQPVNQGEVDAKVAERRTKLPLEQRVLRALNAQIYVSPGAVDVVQELVNTTEQPNEVQIFNAQFSLWMQAAVFEAIATANNGSENVLTSPVKHLIRLDMPMTIAPVSVNSGVFQPGATEGQPAAELKPDASAPLTLNYRTSPYGFANNNMFDPIPVGLTLRVDARRLTEALAAMQGGQLLKVKNVNYRAVNMGRALQEGYVYDKDGTTPMVEVTLDCELLVLRSWVVGYMPETVKQYFAALSSPPPAS